MKAKEKPEFLHCSECKHTDCGAHPMYKEEKSCKYKSMTCPDECKEIKKSCDNYKHKDMPMKFYNALCCSCGWIGINPFKLWEPREEEDG